MEKPTHKRMPHVGNYCPYAFRGPNSCGDWANKKVACYEEHATNIQIISKTRNKWEEFWERMIIFAEKKWEDCPVTLLQILFAMTKENLNTPKNEIFTWLQ